MANASVSPSAPATQRDKSDDTPAARGLSTPAVAVESLHKQFGSDVQAVRDVSLEIGDGEFISVLGPSGSGKTTLLMMIAGFQLPTSGRIYASGDEITRLPPAKRNFGVVFQSYALFPHMTVRRNVGYPLAARRISRRERRRRVSAALELVGLEQLGARRPGELSGGQQQRVALARALVYEPAVLLLDEPLGALDRALRERMQTELRLIHDRVGCTFLYVTHDQEEALTMSDRVVVMHNGRIEQVGMPVDVYSRPANRFVATFVGTANLIPARVADRRGGDRFLARLESGDELLAEGAAGAPGEHVELVFRPEQLTLATSPPRTDEPRLRLCGTVERVSFAGSVWRYQIATETRTVDVAASRPAHVAPGDTAYITSEEERIWAIHADESLQGEPKREEGD